MATPNVVWSCSRSTKLLLLCAVLWTGPMAAQAQEADDCGQEMTTSAGEITHTGYLESGNTSFCEWSINVSSTDLVQLTLHELYWDTDGQDCRDSTNVSRLEVLQPTGDNGVLEPLAIFCGNDYQWWPVRSTTNSLLVRLSLTAIFGYYDYYYTSSMYFNFYATYTSVNAQDVNSCGGDVETTEGEITSANYPGNYDNLSDCQWNITVGPMYTLFIAIHDIDIPHADDGYYYNNCGLDSLWIHDGDSTLAPLLGNRWCGHHGGFDANTNKTRYLWSSLKSSSNSVLVRFVTGNRTASGRGFRLTWTAVCEKTIADDEGTIQLSPNPDVYPEDLSCDYQFEASYYHDVYYHINITALSQEPVDDGSCDTNYVEIIWQTSATLGGLHYTKVYCPSSLPKQLIVHSHVVVRFVSTPTNQSTGFQLEYQRREAECGPSVLTSSSGEITSPGYPAAFPRNINCTQTIQVAENNTITLFASYFFLGYGHSEDCLYQNNGAVVSVYDGDASENGTLLIRLCGNLDSLNTSLTSTTNKVTIVFQSREYYHWYEHRSGYHAFYFTTKTRSECGLESKTDQQGEIGLPSYEDHWRTGVCVWNITVSHGYRVQLTVDTFHLGFAVHGSFYPGYYPDAPYLQDCRNKLSSRLELFQPNDQNGQLELLAKLVFKN